MLEGLLWEGESCCCFVNLSRRLKLLELAHSIELGVCAEGKTTVIRGLFRGYSLAFIVKVVVKHHEVIVLWDMVSKVIMLAQKPSEFGGGSVIGNLPGFYALSLEHFFKDFFSLASSLNGFVHIKI